MPPGFSWVDAPHFAALAFPSDAEDLAWLRKHGIDILISLTEETPTRRGINDAGLLSVHIPISDMAAPTQVQLKHAVETIERATASKMGVAVHCAAGLGRTGTILAAYFVQKGMHAVDALDHVRRMRPGSIETSEQEEAVLEYSLGLHDDRLA
jgi:atypical dual specificity phosphatase